MPAITKFYFKKLHKTPTGIQIPKIKAKFTFLQSTEPPTTVTED